MSSYRPETGVHKAWLAAAVTVFLWSREERADALSCACARSCPGRAHGAGMPVEEVERASSPKLLLELFFLLFAHPHRKKWRFFTSGTGKEKKKLGAAGAVRRPETNGGEIRFFRRIVLHLGPPHPLTISGGARAPS